MGIQLVAAPGNDALLLEAAAALEATLRTGLQNGAPRPKKGTGALGGAGPETAAAACKHAELYWRTVDVVSGPY